MNSLVGQSISQYEIRQLIGLGGMGAVYLAYQSNLDREVAIKVLTPRQGYEDLYQRRFAVEARTAAALEHSHIVPVYDYGTEGNNSYIVMRLLTGGSLDQRLAPGKPPLSIAEVVRVVGEIASGLNYAHSKGIVHRDIKPSNVMFDDRGTLFMVDFGIAKLANATTGLTETNQQIGTPRYMAPEQWRGDTIGPAADQYSLAILCYQMLTGKILFKADASHEYMHRHLYDMPPLLENWQDHLPRAIIPVLARALRKHPSGRYPDIEVFASELKRAAERITPPDAVEQDLAEALEHPLPPNDTLILGGEEPVSTPIIASEEAPPAVVQPVAPVEAPAAAPSTMRAEKTHLLPDARRWGAVLAALLVGGLVLGLILLNGGGDNEAVTATQTAAALALLPTDTPTDAPTDAPTATFTSTATDTDVPPSATPTATLTATAAPSDTPHPTATATSTQSRTPTGEPTVTVMLRSTAAPTSGPTEQAALAGGAATACADVDFNGDGKVDILDLRALAATFGAAQGDEVYNEKYDLDKNHIINILDLRRVSSHYGTSCTE